MQSLTSTKDLHCIVFSHFVVCVSEGKEKHLRVDSNVGSKRHGFNEERYNDAENPTIFGIVVLENKKWACHTIRHEDINNQYQSTTSTHKNT